MGIDHDAYVYHGWKFDSDQVAAIVKRFNLEVPAEDGMDYLWGALFRHLDIDRQSGLTYAMIDDEPLVVAVGACTATLRFDHERSVLVGVPPAQMVADLAVLQKALDLPSPQVWLVGVVW